MNIKEIYMGQPVALIRSPGEMLGTVVSIKKKMVGVKLRDSDSIQNYGIKVLIAYKGGS